MRLLVGSSKQRKPLCSLLIFSLSALAEMQKASPSPQGEWDVVKEREREKDSSPDVKKGKREGEKGGSERKRGW